LYGGMYLPPYFFLPQHIIFFKKYYVVERLSQHIDIVLCAMSATQYFLKNIRVVVGLSQHIIF